MATFTVFAFVLLVGALLVTARAVRAMSRDATDGSDQRAQREEAFRHATLHDPLTGVANRAQFWQRAEEVVVAAGAAGEPVAVVYLDLDGFRSVNDRLGHHIGDFVLAEIAARLGRRAGEGSVVARVGGDEFAVLVVGAGAADELAQAILYDLADPVMVGGVPVRVGASVGVAVADGAVSPARILQAADTLMHSVKQHWPGTYAVCRLSALTGSSR